MNRRSIEVEGLHHGGAPIPLASRVGPLVASSGIIGMDPATGEIADGLEAQVGFLFSNMERILATAGASFDDVVKVTFFVRDRASRDVINVEWLRAFPDEAARPARHTMVHDLPGTMLVQAELLAYVGS